MSGLRRGAFIGMHWFPVEHQTCAWLVLLALAVQLVLSFGHFHGVVAQGRAIDSVRPAATAGV